MAQIEIQVGSAANDGTGNKIRVGGQAINANLTELFGKVAILEAQIASAILNSYRSVQNEVCDGTENQTILYSSVFYAACTITIIDKEGRGVELVSQNENGFVINSQEAGTFSYIAILEY